MVEAGDVLENLVSGQHLIIRITAQDTGGELLEVESVYTKPTPSRPPVHQDVEPAGEDLEAFLLERVVVDGRP